MIIWFSIISFLSLFLLHYHHIHAHSTTRSQPIQQVYQLHSASLHILPRISTESTPSNTLKKRSLIPPSPADLRHNDTILVSFSIPTITSSTRNSTSTPFTLVLHPTPDLIHPEAKINYHSFDSDTGQTTFTTVPLLPEHVLAYTGWVIEESSVESWWTEEHESNVRTPTWASSFDDPRVLGWARILVHDTSQMKSHDHLDQFVCEGSFTINGQLWHLKPLETFNKIKHSEDPIAIPSVSHLRGGLVAWREGYDKTESYHTTSNSSHLHSSGVFSRSTPQQNLMCGHDKLAFNINPDHQLYHPSIIHQTTSSQSSQSLFPTSNPGPFSSLSKRSRTHTKRSSLDHDISGSAGLTLSNFSHSIGSTNGCPSESKVVFIGIAADCNYVSKYGTQEEARTAILNNLNSVSGLYSKSFNISLGIVEMNVQAPQCPDQPHQDTPWNVPCSGSGPNPLDLNQRLSIFSQWRGIKGGSDGAGLWHLMTDCPSGEEVGVAWFGQVCVDGAVYGTGGEVTSGTGVTASTSNEWSVMAHEIGHSFGAIHDCVGGCESTDTCCPMSTSSCDSNAEYIMSPQSSSIVSEFSPCSIGNICSALKAPGIDLSCLISPGQRKVISLKQCGNGIVEPGEDCDPGEGKSSECCDVQTCKFVEGAVCDPMNSERCCTGQCQFASSGLICREARDSECDQAARCTGTSAVCPENIAATNGKACGSSGGGLTCTSGLCTSRDKQCQIGGAHLGLKTACGPTATGTCQLACVDPSGQADCILLQNKFLDGTSCGNGGQCVQGICKGGHRTANAADKSWFL
ncbi:Disintegrin-like metalloprotease [Melampsora americana]|nr:Disintegrin-like metalloprotease [Melampsora americana]